MIISQAAHEVGQLAQRMADGYFVHYAALSVATNPQAMALAPKILPKMYVPVGFVRRKDGTEHVFHFTHYLQLAQKNVEIMHDLKRVWLAAALLTVGDALSQHGYFDRAPELELVRHLRNGIAHGNRFRIDKTAKLKRYPAHNRDAWVRSDRKTIFEITAQLEGKIVLFDFMDDGDVLDVLLSVAVYLMNLASGFPLRPVIPAPAGGQK
jgi:hypothetical protein